MTQNVEIMHEYSLEIYGLSMGSHRFFFEIKKHQKQKHDENEKDARRKRIAIRLINSSSTSVSNSNMKKHMIAKSVDIFSLAKHILQISMDYS